MPATRARRALIQRVCCPVFAPLARLACAHLPPLHFLEGHPQPVTARQSQRTEKIHTSKAKKACWDLWRRWQSSIFELGGFSESGFRLLASEWESKALLPTPRAQRQGRYSEWSYLARTSPKLGLRSAGSVKTTSPPVYFILVLSLHPSSSSFSSSYLPSSSFPFIFLPSFAFFLPLSVSFILACTIDNG